MSNTNVRISVPQIAAAMSISEEAVRQWCRSKWLKASKKDGQQEWIIRMEDLIEHLAVTRKHYAMLADSEPMRKKDQDMRLYLLRQIRAFRKLEGIKL